MSKLRSFILTEEARTSHSQHLSHYLETYHTDVDEEVHDEMKRAWVKIVREWRNATPDGDRENTINMLYPKYPILGVHATDKAGKVGSATTNLSVLVSQALSDDDRKKCVEQLLVAAEKAFRKVLADNPKFFEADDNFKVTSAFDAVRNGDTVRLQYKANHRKDEKNGVAKTLFTVGVDPGKLNSKTKHYDRVYLIDNTKR
jgi:hypothetical protein